MTSQTEILERVLSAACAFVAMRRFSEAHAALRTARDIADLHATPIASEYDIQGLAHRLASVGRNPFRPISIPSCIAVGDSGQVRCLIRILTDSARLEFDAELDLSLQVVDDVPVLQCSIDGPGHFPENVDLGFGVSLSREFVAATWTNATRGGRIDFELASLTFRFKGVRMVTDQPTLDEVLADGVREAEQQARLAEAPDSGVGIDVTWEKVHAVLLRVLGVIDTADDARQPADLSTLLQEAMADRDATAPVSVAVEADPGIPPIAILRNRIRRLLKGILTCADTALTHGGSLTLSLDQAPAERTVSIWAQGEGKVTSERLDWFVPTLRRCVEDAHSGRFEVDADSAGFALVATFPDTIARELDDWLPGWDSFAPRSIQMLRLLKSGGPVPPEDLILSGVLEDELERRLLPRLSVAPATTLAHELEPAKVGLTGAAAERLEKALGQIRKGKPKKEICAPAYASVVLQAFGQDDRHRSAIGVDLSYKDAFETLIVQLNMNSINYISALRVLSLALSRPDRK